MDAKTQLAHTLELLKLERKADLEYYRQKILLTSLHQRTKEGTTWYPLRLKREYIGTGERQVVEVERLNNLDKPHSFQSGKSVNFFSNANGKVERDHVTGVVNYVRDNTMLITLNADNSPAWMEDGSLGVDVMFDEMSYREMEYTMKEVMKASDNRVAELREILLGSAAAEFSSAVFEGIHADAAHLNDSQKKALDVMLRAKDVGFIHGPPGTGKTTTLVHAIRVAVSEEGQVLVTAASNAAVDLLVDKLSAFGLEVIRIGHPARVTPQSLSKTLDARIAQHAHYPELKSLRKRMEQLKSMAFKYKKKFGYQEKEQRRLLMQESKSLKSDADLLEFYIINDLFQKAQAVCCTLVGASHPLMRGRKFKTAFIDEASQALEPASWIPILRVSRVIFAGDHLQLPPTIKSAEAAKDGLAITLFEKGIKRHPQMATMLQVQYRMNEEIMKFSSMYFYEGKLRAHPAVRTQTLYPGASPVEFIDTAGCGYMDSQDPETLSRFNAEEAQLVIDVIGGLIEHIGIDHWIDQQLSLAIITPYRAQVDLLIKLAENNAAFEALNPFISINSVDAFQGQERDIVVVSFVRSNDKGEIGFLSDIRRTNVAMTRAKKKLIMVGDSATLATHPFYLALLDHVQLHSYYRSAFDLQRS